MLRMIQTETYNENIQRIKSRCLARQSMWYVDIENIMGITSTRNAKDAILKSQQDNSDDLANTSSKNFKT